jgi:hypothetical protein
MEFMNFFEITTINWFSKATQSVAAPVQNIVADPNNFDAEPDST